MFEVPGTFFQNDSTGTGYRANFVGAREVSSFFHNQRSYKTFLAYTLAVDPPSFRENRYRVVDLLELTAKKTPQLRHARPLAGLRMMMEKR